MMRRVARGLLAFGLLFAAGALTPAPAEAAPPKPPSPSGDAVVQARGHFTHGVKLYEEDDFRAALIEFNRAYELAPNPAVLYNVGQSYYQLRDYANALRVLEQYVALGGSSIPVERRTQVDREIEELRGRLAHVSIAANVDDAEVAVDDTSLGRTPLAPSHVVGAGRHVIRATKQGYVAASQVIDIAGGDEVNVSLTLVPVAPEPEPVVVRPTSFTPALVSVVVGAAAVGVGITFGVLAVNDKSSLKQECRGTSCPSSAQGDINDFSRDGAVSTAGFVVGGVGLAVATVLYLTERGGKEHADARPTKSAFEAHPWLGGTSAGVFGHF